VADIEFLILFCNPNVKYTLIAIIYQFIEEVK